MGENDPASRPRGLYCLRAHWMLSDRERRWAGLVATQTPNGDKATHFLNDVGPTRLELEAGSQLAVFQIPPGTYSAEDGELVDPRSANPTFVETAPNPGRCDTCLFFRSAGSFRAER